MKHVVLVAMNLCFTVQSMAAVFTVQLTPNGFVPSVFNAVCGDTVVWNWVSGTHTTTSSNLPLCASSGYTWNVALHANNTSFTYVIPCGGLFYYQCNFHPAETAYFDVTCTIGVNEHDRADHQFQVYPNPFSEEITIDVKLSGIHSVRYEIVDIPGKTFRTYGWNQPAGEMIVSENLKQLAAGTYLLRMMIDDDIRVLRIVKK